MSEAREPRPAKVGDLLDKEDLCQLAARYVARIDRGWHPGTFDPGAFDGIFAVDATYEMPDLGVSVEGLNAIKASLVAETQSLPFSHHSLTDAVIDIDSDDATADWKMWIVATREGGTRLVLGRMRMTCRREGAGWRIYDATVRIGSTIALAGEDTRLPMP